MPPWPILRFFSYFGTTLDGLVGGSYAWWYFSLFLRTSIGSWQSFRVFCALDVCYKRGPVQPSL